MVENMQDFSISEYYNEGKTGKGANALKFFLMPFMCFMLFGFPGATVGGIVATMSRFVAQAFFILCGFFVLTQDREIRLGKMKRALKRSGLFFLALFIAYFAISAVYLSLSGVDWLPELLNKRVIFSFLVLNLWPLPVGNSIWFIQSLFYAYVILLILDKLRLLRFYKLLLVLLIAFMLFSGEFAGIFRLNILGYYYIPGGFLTRALPYMLIGMLIREKQETFLRPKKGIYLILILVGFVLAYLENELLFRTNTLVYNGHLIGLGLVAIGLCCLALSLPMIGDSFAVAHGRSYTKRIYAICQPVAFLLSIGASYISAGAVEVAQEFLSILTYIVCFVLAYLIGLIKFSRRAPIIEKVDEDEDDDESDYRDFRHEKN